MASRNRSSVRILFLAALLVIPVLARGGMTVLLKDGRSFSIPVNPEEIASISFGAASVSSPSAAPTASSLPVTDGLAAWLDAGDPATLFQTPEGAQPVAAGNQPVGLWRDKSGNDNHFQQAKPESRPRLTKTAIGNKPSITFETKHSTSLPANFPAPVTVVYLGRLTGGSNARVLSAISNNWLLGFWGGAKNQGFYEGWVSPSGSPPADNLPHVFASIVRGPGQSSEVWADGVQVAANQNGVTGPNGLAINSGRYPGEVSDCQVAEILVYSRALSGDERSQIESYLRSKWGVGR